MRNLHSNSPRFLVCASLVLLVGCHSNDPTTGTIQVEGQVIQNQKPVGNGTVQVYLAGKGGGYGAVGDPVPCDASGHFAFDFTAESRYGYIVKAEAPPGYITDWDQAPHLTAGHKNIGLVIPVLAPAWVRLVLVDEPPKSQIFINIQ